ncbi:hypothetical protein D5R95_05075 [Methanosalsum natronophilum]|uniref:Uncharacterized protein n=1 Tax=Methanosalsum natronophilum TaxID=768733 RepID=A0A424YXW8_9EURY|nr:MAG: hypothetical protein D5R95_05075 [Methanosalsum natronophilum]
MVETSQTDRKADQPAIPDTALLVAQFHRCSKCRLEAAPSNREGVLPPPPFHESGRAAFTACGSRIRK